MTHFLHPCDCVTTSLSSIPDLSNPINCAPCPPPNFDYDDFHGFATEQNLTECEIDTIADICKIPKPVLNFTTEAHESGVTQTTVAESTFTTYTPLSTTTTKFTESRTTVDTEERTDKTVLTVSVIVGVVVVFVSVIVFVYWKKRKRSGNKIDNANSTSINGDHDEVNNQDSKERVSSKDCVQTDNVQMERQRQSHTIDLVNEFNQDEHTHTDKSNKHTGNVITEHNNQEDDGITPFVIENNVTDAKESEDKMRKSKQHVTKTPIVNVADNTRPKEDTDTTHGTINDYVMQTQEQTDSTPHLDETTKL